VTRSTRAARTLTIGMTPDGEIVSIPCETSQRILVCGKTGTGKSYTLGVIAEELVQTVEDIVFIVDPQGIFWTMAQASRSDEARDALWQYDRRPYGFPVNILVPGDPIERYGDVQIVDEMRRRGIHPQPLRLNPSDLSPEMWCDLFDLNIDSLQGIILFKAVRECVRRIGRGFLIDDISDEVTRSRGLDQTKEAVERRLEMARDWQIFSSDEYREIWDILQPGAINILDLSVIGQGRYGLRNLIISVICTYIFRQRTIARRREQFGLTSGLPKVWLLVDEAHNFCPSSGSTLATEILVRWAKEGRQPGLSLVVATQQPAALSSEILTQCGIRIVHRLTAKEDFRAVDALSQDYLGEGIATRIRALNGPGMALVIDDQRETAVTVHIRPRQSEHGGGSA